MINLMRKNQRWLMILISIIVIVAFVFLYNRADLEKLGKTAVGTIYGNPVEGTEFARMERQYDIARSLGMYELLQLLSTGGSREQAGDYVWNTLVLRKQAELLQIEPSVEAVTKRIQELAPFQTEGQFDLEKYNNFTANVLTPRGFSQAQVEEIIRDDLRRERLHDLVGSSSAVGENEVRDAYGEAFRKRHLQVVKLQRAAFSSSAQVTPDEIRQTFEKNRARYQTDEKRTVKYVVFQLSEAEKKLTGKERVAALQPLSDQADSFSQRIVKADTSFAEIAQELGAEIKTTAPFAESSVPGELSSVPQFGATVFSLSQENPDSDVLQTESAFYIVHLEKIDPAIPQTLDEATPAITKELGEEKISAALNQRAAELRTAFRAALQAGQTFAQAVEAAGLKMENVAPYSPAEEQQKQEMNPDRLIQMRAANLGEGMVGDLIPTPEGGAIAYLEKLEPLDEAKWNSEKETIMDRYGSSRREVAFQEWFRAQRVAANVRVGQPEA